MSISLQQMAQNRGLLSDDDVLPHLSAWQRDGLRTALVTLVGVDGGAPRQAGAQMAVAEDGRYVGYLSGGCLEAAVAEEARHVISSGTNRTVRYGKGSPYFDIKLPCGSGLDLYFDQRIGSDMINELLRLRAARRTATLHTSLLTGDSGIVDAPAMAPVARSRREDDAFLRVYPPPLRLLLLGTGPSIVAIASIARAVGLGLTVWSPDEPTRQSLLDVGAPAGGDQLRLVGAIDELDAASAVVVVFHDHGAEPDILGRILKTESFYVGVLGNHAVHRQRLAALQNNGFDATSRARLRAPVGSIAGAKSTATLAVGVLAEILETAKTLNLAA